MTGWGLNSNGHSVKAFGTVCPLVVRAAAVDRVPASSWPQGYCIRDMLLADKVGFLLKKVG